MTTATPARTTAAERLANATREREAALALATTLRGQLAQATAAGLPIAERVTHRTELADAEATVQELAAAIELLSAEAAVEAEAAAREELAEAQTTAEQTSDAAMAALRDLETVLHGWARKTFVPRYNAAVEASHAAQAAQGRALDLAGEDRAFRDPFELPLFGLDPDGRVRETDFHQLARFITAYARYSAAPRGSSNS